jgi:hypothetical protein
MHPHGGVAVIFSFAALIARHGSCWFCSNKEVIIVLLSCKGDDAMIRLLCVLLDLAVDKFQNVSP